MSKSRNHIKKEWNDEEPELKASWDIREKRRQKKLRAAIKTRDIEALSRYDELDDQMMPIYTFRNKETGEEITELMSMSDRDKYLEDNPNMEQALTSPPIVSGVSTRLNPDKGFREILSRVKKNNPKSKINDFGG